MIPLTQIPLTLRRRLQGAVFLAIVISLVALSVAKYSGAFSRGVPVTLRVDHTGLQLDPHADVKVRGLVVGEVTGLSSSGSGATVEMTLNPDTAHLIPDNVSARLLPKTLFGEKYVSLILPARPSGRMLSAGDVIPQDRGQPARELDAALDALLPLLQAVPPQELASTLGAVSSALRGRGQRLGDTLIRVQQLVSGLNTALPPLQEDITRAADLANTYTQAAPDLLAALADLSITTRTVAEQRRNLALLWPAVIRGSDDLRVFLRDNRENLISLAADIRPTLVSLARYAPEYPCLLNQIAGLVPQLDRAFGVGSPQPGLHIYLEVTNHRGKYLPGVDEPRYQEDRGPRCYPVRDGTKFPEYPGGPIHDGSTSPPTGRFDPSPGVGSASTGPAGTGPQTAGPQTAAPQTAGAPMGLPNSPSEQWFLAVLLATADGRRPEDVPAWDSFLLGPLLRGTEVSLR
ncbi:MAG TPA: MCE family protein [Pseudonocardiaceae bacterium]|nr:MCE family protein [Pseudonocardiaceae bacterium]